MSFFRKKRFFFILFIGFVFILFYNDWIAQFIYPIPYEESVRTYAENFDVDPYLIAAIIRVESNFKQDKVSKKGAVGMMQLMPETADWIAQQGQFRTFTIDNIMDPDANIEAGAWYIRSLTNQFIKGRSQGTENDLALIAAAYNAGPGNLTKWLNEGIWDGTINTTDRIPFGETRHYIRRVLYYYQKYVSIHG